MCGRLICGRDIGLGYRYAMSLCDLDITFDLAVMTLTFTILLKPCLENCICKLWEIDTW